MKPYHKRFRRIHPAIQREARRMRRGWATKTVAEKQEAIRVFVDAASGIYGIAKPNVQFADGSDWYLPAERIISLGEPSAITAWHEFRHHWQSETQEHFVATAELEDDARAWSLSLFFSVAPQTLQRLARQDRVIHLTGNMENRDSR